MPLRLGDTEVTALYLGDTAVTRAYLGDVEVFAPAAGGLGVIDGGRGLRFTLTAGRSNHYGSLPFRGYSRRDGHNDGVTNPAFPRLQEMGVYEQGGENQQLLIFFTAAIAGLASFTVEISGGFSQVVNRSGGFQNREYRGIRLSDPPLANGVTYTVTFTASSGTPFAGYL